MIIIKMYFCVEEVVFKHGYAQEYLWKLARYADFQASPSRDCELWVWSWDLGICKFSQLPRQF